MGFFSDLKEDLSHAVNDLTPGQTPENAQDDDMISLDEMLKNIDSIEIPSEIEDPEDEVVETDEEEDFMKFDPLAKETEEHDEETSTKEPFEEMVTEEETVTEEAVEEEATEEEAVAEESVEEEAADEEAVAEESAAEELVTEETNEDWDIDSMLESALTAEAVQAVEKTEENKGDEMTMEISTNRTALDETSVITAGMSITGDIASEGSLDLIGTVIGNIDVLGKLNITGHIQGNSKAAEIYAEGAKINGEIVSDGSVKIGASTVIVGNITATSAAIAGAVKGDIDVRGPVVLDASAIVMGNIKSKSVQINNGAVIEGMCSQCYADVSPTSFFEDYKMEMKKAK